MDCVGACTLRNPDDFLDIEIRLGGRCRAKMVSLIGLAHMKSSPVYVGVHGYRLEPHLPARSNHAHRDFSPIGDENLLEHARGSAAALAATFYRTSFGTEG